MNNFENENVEIDDKLQPHKNRPDPQNVKRRDRNRPYKTCWYQVLKE
jgi:hypothetical protein